MKKISEILAKYQTKKFSFKKCDEYQFFKSNRKLLSKTNYGYFYQIDNSFQLICANAVIYSIQNKQTLDAICKDLFSSIFLKSKLTNDDFLKYYHARIVDLKYIQADEIKIYIPLFPYAINYIYFNDPFKLLEAPYDMLLESGSSNFIDLFELYNIKLFDSFFTKLVKIKTSEKATAFYHFDLATIFIINNQGRLDYAFPLFDKWMNKINTSHISERIVPTIDAYFENDKIKIIDKLLENSLISQKMHDLIIKKTIN